MTDRHINFRPYQVRAALDGRLSQTRRVLKPLPRRTIFFDHKTAVLDQFQEPPYAPGDLLWVREAWARVPVSAYRASEGVDQRQSPFDYEAAIYRAGFDRSQGGIHWRSPIHMPIWASRLTLLVTDVRVQRLQEISRGDAMEEGCPFANMADGPNPRDWYRDIWDSIHGPDAWDANPWVAAISFTVHRCNIDKMEEGTWL